MREISRPSEFSVETKILLIGEISKLREISRVKEFSVENENSVNSRNFESVFGNFSFLWNFLLSLKIPNGVELFPFLLKFKIFELFSKLWTLDVFDGF